MHKINLKREKIGLETRTEMCGGGFKEDGWRGVRGGRMGGSVWFGGDCLLKNLDGKL